MQKRIALILICTCMVTNRVLAADKQNSYWLLFEQGNAAMDAKEFGQALKLYQEAILQAGIFPEAEMAIGEVYLEEGETALAIAQYEKAYTIMNAFYIPEMQYDVLYKLAHIYETQELYKKMEDALIQITNDDSHFVESTTLKLRTQIEKNFLEKGLDRVLVLYAFEDSFSAAAHSKLGWFYYRTGRFSQSVPHLLYSIIYRATRMEQYLKERDVDFQFSSLQDLLEIVDKNQDLRKYAEESGFYADLYYIAAATFANGYPQSSSVLWKLISGFPAAGKYQELSKSQLKSPRIEPLLNISQ